MIQLHLRQKARENFGLVDPVLNDSSIERRIYDICKYRIPTFNSLKCFDGKGRVDTEEKIRVQMERLPQLPALQDVKYDVNRKTGNIEVYYQGKRRVPR